MIGRSHIEGESEIISSFPDENTLYTSDKVLVSEWVKRGLIIKVNMDDKVLYYRPIRSMETPPKRPRLAPLRQTPNQKHLILLQKELDTLRDRHRKLKMLTKSGNEHGDLPTLITKWRSACHQALDELKNFIQPSMRSRPVLDSLGVQYETLKLELSTDDEKGDESLEASDKEEGYNSYEE